MENKTVEKQPRHKCPKCKSGLPISSEYRGTPINHCPMCGLYYERGSSTESLRKQILGEDFRPTRKELREHDL